MITAEVNVIPIGTSTSIGGLVKKFIRRLKNKRLKIMPGPMGTALEAMTTKELFEAIDEAHNAIFSEKVQRVVTTIRIDDRRDKSSTLKHKLKSLE